jgi:hypothetical protein
MTVERSDPGEWMVTVERGKADSVQVMFLSDMERAQLAALLSNESSLSVTFRDILRG